MGILNIVSLLWLIVLFFYSNYVLKQNEKVQSKFLIAQLSLAFLYNVVMFALKPWKFPIELSTVSYFVVPMIVFLNIKPLKVWAVYASLLTAGVYFLGMLFIGQTLYGNFPAYSVYTSIYNHGALISFAYITLHTTKFQKQERFIIWGGIVFSAAWALLLRPFVTFTGRIFILIVLDADLISAKFPNHLTIGYIIYYIVFVILLYVSSNMVHSLSTIFYTETRKEKA